MNLPFDDKKTLFEILKVDEFLKDKDLVTDISAVEADTMTMPVIVINRKAYSYPEAMKYLKTKTMKVPEHAATAS